LLGGEIGVPPETNESFGGVGVASLRRAASLELGTWTGLDLTSLEGLAGLAVFTTDKGRLSRKLRRAESFSGVRGLTGETIVFLKALASFLAGVFSDVILLFSLSDRANCSSSFSALLSSSRAVVASVPLQLAVMLARRSFLTCSVMMATASRWPSMMLWLFRRTL